MQEYRTYVRAYIIWKKQKSEKKKEQLQAQPYLGKYGTEVSGN